MLFGLAASTKVPHAAVLPCLLQGSWGAQPKKLRCLSQETFRNGMAKDRSGRLRWCFEFRSLKQAEILSSLSRSWLLYVLQRPHLPLVLCKRRISTQGQGAQKCSKNLNRPPEAIYKHSVQRSLYRVSFSQHKSGPDRLRA